MTEVEVRLPCPTCLGVMMLLTQTLPVRANHLKISIRVMVRMNFISLSDKINLPFL